MNFINPELYTVPNLNITEQNYERMRELEADHIYKILEYKSWEGFRKVVFQTVQVMLNTGLGYFVVADRYTKDRLLLVHLENNGFHVRIVGGTILRKVK